MAPGSEENFRITVSKLSNESTALDLAALSCAFMSRQYLVLHSVMITVRAEERREEEVLLPQSAPGHKSTAGYVCTLTEVEEHADEDDEAKPGIEVGDEVDNGDDDVRDSREDAEGDIAGER